METFNKNTEELITNLNTLDKKIKIMQDFLSKINNLFNVLTDLINLLTDIETLTNVSHILLSFISVIPRIGPDIIIIDGLIKKLGNNISSQKIIVKKFLTEFVDPIKNRINGLEQRLKDFTKTTNDLSHYIFIIKNKIDTEHSNKIDNIVIKLNPSLIEINKNLIELITFVDRIDTETENIEAKLLFITNANTNMGKILKELRSFHAMMLPVSRAMDHRITIPYKIIIEDTITVLAYVWHFISFWKSKEKFITYRISEIFCGIENITEAVKTELKVEAGKYLEPILEKINLKFSITEFIGLNEIEKEIMEIGDLIKTFDFDLLYELIDRTEIETKNIAL